MEKNSETQNKVVQTYAEDMAKVIGGEKDGLIKKIIHQEGEHEKEKRSLSPESKKNRFFLMIGFLFTGLGLITFFYFLLTRDTPPVPIQKQFVPIVFIDKNIFLEIKDFNKEKISQTVLNEVRGTLVKNGGVEAIYLTSDKKVIGLREFMALIKGNFSPDTFVHDPLFIDDNFLMGVVNDETKDFFIVLKMRSMADIFDALRAWEGKMLSDLGGFFGVDIIPETKYLLTALFQDGIIENKNARILYDSDNKMVMMYVLVDDTSVVITNTESAAREIMLRLAVSRVKK